MPLHFHDVFLNDAQHTHPVTPTVFSPSSPVGNAASGAGFSLNNNATAVASLASSNITVRDQAGGAGNANRTATRGGGVAHNNMSPFMLGSFFIRL
jgi:microcystin-dependent protein